MKLVEQLARGQSTDREAETVQKHWFIKCIFHGSSMAMAALVLVALSVVPAGAAAHTERTAVGAESMTATYSCGAVGTSGFTATLNVTFNGFPNPQEGTYVTVTVQSITGPAVNQTIPPGFIGTSPPNNSVPVYVYANQEYQYSATWVDGNSVPGGAGPYDVTTTCGSTPPPVVQGTVSRPVVAMAATPDGGGYWMAGADGSVQAFGDAQFYGSMAGQALNAPIISMAPTADGKGYWLLGEDGGVFSFGDAQFYGSTGGIHLNKPVVGMTATPDGHGYYLDASDGGIFTFGDAHFYGSMGGTPLNQPVVGMSIDPKTGGYWEVAYDGGIFSFNAPFFGSAGNIHLNQPIVGMTNTPTGQGYRFVASDGGIFDFGDAAFYGSAG
jgi:hypothetical protein